MPTAHAVIGASYGDEGKGLVTDFLCSAFGADCVVRFNGGAQAGHTVETPSGERHIFHHIGSGTFAGAATYLSSFFICNPILFNEEWWSLSVFRRPHVYVDWQCLISTPFDMMLNQAIERARGIQRHGSCGVGINETIVRSEEPAFRITASHLTNDSIRDVLLAIGLEYVPQRMKALGLDFESIREQLDVWKTVTLFLADVREFMLHTQLTGPRQIAGATHLVFEGAQGLLLDQNNEKDFPYLTRSNTGMQNVRALADLLECEKITPVYVTRPYLTRHGAGPLPFELAAPPFPKIRDETNLLHPWQGELRYAYLDIDALGKRIQDDCGDDSMNICVTCVDHISKEYTCIRGGERITSDTMAEGFGCLSYYIGLRSIGPTRADVTAVMQL